MSQRECGSQNQAMGATGKVQLRATNGAEVLLETRKEMKRKKNFLVSCFYIHCLVWITTEKKMYNQHDPQDYMESEEKKHDFLENTHLFPVAQNTSLILRFYFQSLANARISWLMRIMLKWLLNPYILFVEHWDSLWEMPILARAFLVICLRLPLWEP